MPGQPRVMPSLQIFYNQGPGPIFSARFSNFTPKNRNSKSKNRNRKLEIETRNRNSKLKLEIEILGQALTMSMAIEQSSNWPFMSRLFMATIWTTTWTDKVYASLN